MADRGTGAILSQARAWRAQGRQVALATVLETWGSAPRPPGAYMVVAEDGAFEGSVSGGCVEVAVVDEAAGVLADGVAKVVEYGVADEDAWAVGLACGGTIRVLIERLGPGGFEDELLAALLQAREDEDAVVVATDLGGNGHALIAAAGDATGGDPQRAVHVSPDDVGEALRLDRAHIVEEGGRRVFLRPHNPPVRVVLVGAVHVAQALAPLVDATGYRAVVVDPRDAFATPARFAQTRLMRRWPAEALAELGPDARTAVVVLTHDPKFDDDALVAALASPAFYVGALGSRQTHARRLDRLREAGVDEEALARIRAPIGLDIGARSPEEIAVAILAQIVAALRRPDRSA